MVRLQSRSLYYSLASYNCSFYRSKFLLIFFLLIIVFIFYFINIYSCYSYILYKKIMDSFSQKSPSLLWMAKVVYVFDVIGLSCNFYFIFILLSKLLIIKIYNYFLFIYFFLVRLIYILISPLNGRRTIPYWLISIIKKYKCSIFSYSYNLRNYLLVINNIPIFI